MKMIDADALKNTVKKFQDNFPLANARHYMCDVFLSMIDDVAQVPYVDVVPDSGIVIIGKEEKDAVD